MKNKLFFLRQICFSGTSCAVLILAVPSFAEPLQSSKHKTTTSQTSLTPLTDKDYEKTCATLAPDFGNAKEPHREVLEALSSEIGQQIIKLALELEASSEAASKKAMPLELILAKRDYNKMVDFPPKKTKAEELQHTGVSVLVVALVAKNSWLPDLAEVYRMPKSAPTLVSVGSGASGVNSFVKGTLLYHNNLDEKYISDSADQVEKLQYYFIGDALLDSYAAYWSGLLAANEKERLELNGKLEKALRREVERAVGRAAREENISAPNYDIDILDLLRTYQLSSPEKINALQRLRSKLKKYRQPPCLSEGVDDDFFDFAYAQLRMLNLLIEELSRGQTSTEQLYDINEVNKRTLTEARAKRDELWNTLKALANHYGE